MSTSTSSRAKTRVLVNTDHGKGKSSAAFGVMGRAWARGWTVAVVQFVKGGKWQVGEKKLADHLGIEWHTLGDGFTWESEDLDETAATNRHAWDVAKTYTVTEMRKIKHAYDEGIGARKGIEY